MLGFFRYTSSHYRRITSICGSRVPFFREMSNINPQEKPLIFAPRSYQYDKGHLNEEEIGDDPLIQFKRWFEDAEEACKGSSLPPEAASFSTAHLPSGRVSSRIVLFKELDTHGFIVFSNWNSSKKSRDFNTNRYGALTFFWPQLQRQVRVEGIMETVSREISESYFASRPRGSKIGAWASAQSLELQTRQQLDQKTKDFEKKFELLSDQDIPCPDYWGGVRLVPLETEFWQGRVSRLHDRLVFRRDKVDEQWKCSRLSP